jgi:hypothetical protein
MHAVPPVASTRKGSLAHADGYHRYAKWEQRMSSWTRKPFIKAYVYDQNGREAAARGTLALLIVYLELANVRFPPASATDENARARFPARAIELR